MFTAGSGDPRRTELRVSGRRRGLETLAERSGPADGGVFFLETLAERSNRTVVTSGEWQVKTEWPVASGGWRVKPKGGR